MGIKARGCCGEKVVPPCVCAEAGLPGGMAFHEPFDDSALPGWTQTVIGLGIKVIGPPGELTFIATPGIVPEAVIQVRDTSVLINPVLDDFCLCMRFSAIVGSWTDDPNPTGGGLRDLITAAGGSTGPGVAIVRTNSVVPGTDFFTLTSWSALGVPQDLALVVGDSLVHDWTLCMIGDTVTIRQDGVLLPFAFTRAQLIGFGLPNLALPVSVFADTGDQGSFIPGDRSIVTVKDYCANWVPNEIPCPIPNVPDIQTTTFFDLFNDPALPQWNVSGVPSVAGGHLQLNVVFPASPQIVLFGATPFNVNPEQDDWCVCNTARYVTPQAGSAQLLGIANPMNGAVDLMIDAQFPTNFQLLVTNSVGSSHQYDTGVAVAPFINAHHDYQLCHVSGTQTVDIYIDGLPVASINTNVVGLDPALVLTSHIAAFNQFSVVPMVFDIDKSSARKRSPPA